MQVLKDAYVYRKFTLQLSSKTIFQFLFIQCNAKHKISEHANNKVNESSQAKNVVENVEISECEKVLRVKWADGHKSK